MKHSLLVALLIKIDARWSMETLSFLFILFHIFNKLILNYNYVDTFNFSTEDDLPHFDYSYSLSGLLMPDYIMNYIWLSVYNYLDINTGPIDLTRTWLIKSFK